MKLHRAAQLPWITLSFVVLIMPLIFIFAGAAVAANNRAVAWVNLGKPATIRGAYRSILPRLGRYLWLMTIIAFFIYIPFRHSVHGLLPVSLSVCASQRASLHPGPIPIRRPPSAFGLVSLAFFLLAFAAVVYAVFMGLRYSLALPASVLEDSEGAQRHSPQYRTQQGLARTYLRSRLADSFIQLGLVADHPGPLHRGGVQGAWATPGMDSDRAASCRVLHQQLYRAHVCHRSHPLLLRPARAQRRLRHRMDDGSRGHESCCSRPVASAPPAPAEPVLDWSSEIPPPPLPFTIEPTTALIHRRSGQ